MIIVYLALAFVAGFLIGGQMMKRVMIFSILKYLEDEHGMKLTGQGLKLEALKK
jgi:hypothetical protein